MNETLKIWARHGAGWLIEYTDDGCHLVSVVVTDAIDFARFRADWICPIASKIRDLQA